MLFPLITAGTGIWYLGQALSSLYSGRIRTLPKTYVEKARLPVTYWLLFVFYIVCGLLITWLGLLLWTWFWPFATG